MSKGLTTGYWIFDARFLIDMENTQFVQSAKNKVVRK